MTDSESPNEEAIQELTDRLKSLWEDGSPAPEHEDSRFTITPPEESDFYNEGDCEEISAKYMDIGLVIEFNLPGLLPEPYRNMTGGVFDSDDPASTELLTDDQLEVIWEVVQAVDERRRNNWAGAEQALEYQVIAKGGDFESSAGIEIISDSRSRSNSYDISFISKGNVDLNPFGYEEDDVSESESERSYDNPDYKARGKLAKKLRRNLRTNGLKTPDFGEGHEFWVDPPEESSYYDDGGKDYFYGRYDDSGLKVYFTVEGGLPDQYKDSDEKHIISHDPRPLELLSDKQAKLVSGIVRTIDDHERMNWVGIDQPIYYELMVRQKSDSSIRVGVYGLVKDRGEVRASFITEPTIEWEFSDDVEQAIDEQ